jgi:two-component system, chemotaxis family, protein-glutamate methylesterase/glutaminase
MRHLDVILIGGSAGALEGLLAILPALPDAFAIPIVVVLHLAPTQPNLVPELLQRATRRRVAEIDDKQPLRGDTVHVAPANYHVLIERDRTLSLSVDELVHFSRPSIDVLFESAAVALHAGVAGILLSGANEDGATGLERIADAGGLAVIQDPATSRHSTMPSIGVVRLRGRAHVLPVGNIAAFLAGLDSAEARMEHAR